MKAIAFISLAILALSGCDEYSGLYIDESCSAREVALIETAVERFNAVVPVDYEVLLMGRVSATNDDRTGEGPESRDVIMCFDVDTSEPELQNYNGDSDRKYTGKIDYDDILLRRRLDENEDRWLHTVMHELDHYGAGAWHVTDPDSVMYKHNNPVTNYTKYDVAEFSLRLGRKEKNSDY